MSFLPFLPTSLFLPQPLCTLHAKLIAHLCCVIGLLSPLLLPLFSSGAVFTGYYQKNPPGVYFSLPIFFSLLWALLKAGMLSEVFSVLSVGLAHNIVVSVAVLTLTTEKTKQLIDADMRLDVDLVFFLAQPRVPPLPF